MRGIHKAFMHSRDGLIAACLSERAIRQEVGLFVIALPLALFVGKDMYQRSVLIASMLGVLVIELLNTCLEKLCDHVTPSFDSEIKRIKDMGSAAVLLALVAAGMLWCAVLADNLGIWSKVTVKWTPSVGPLEPIS